MCSKQAFVKIPEKKHPAARDTASVSRKAAFWRVFIFVFALTAYSAFADSPHFPVPDIIKPNVAFWVRIYTEIGLQEGLLHDREHPQVTYEKVAAGGRTGRARSDFIDERRQIYVNAISTIRDSTPDKWGAVERRVSELFKSAPAGALDSAEFRIRHQTGQRERFRAGLERSGAYIDTISAILKQHGVPDELKYLPHVESSFDAEAYSRVGAAGLWQFMRATGRGYMKIDYMFDERRDAIISTRAAAKFLRANYDMLGAWPLAVTAYNHGPNGIRRAVESVGSRDIAEILQKHESPSFKFASRNFYSCFVAVLQIMENPDRYFRNVRYRPRWEATSVRMPAAMTPNAVLRATGVTEREFKQLNPSFRPVVFTQQRAIPEGYHINLPVAIDAQEALAALTRSSPPLPQRPAAAVAAATPSTAARADTRPRERTRAQTTPAPAPAIVRDGEESYYTVVRGDHLHGISRRLGVPTNELAAANNITNSSRIFVGQVLRIPGSASSTVAARVDTAQVVDTAATVTEVAAATQETLRTSDDKDTASVSAHGSIQVDKDAESTPEPIPAPIKAVAPTIAGIDITIKPSYDTTWTRIVDSTRIIAANTVVTIADTAKTISADTVKTVTDTAKTTVVGTVVADIDTTKTAVADTVSAPPETISAAAAFTEAVPAPEPVAASGRHIKPTADTRFDANVYDLGMTVAPGGSSVQVRVSVDETIGHFAEWMRVNAADIRRANDLAPNASLQLGKTIAIPITSSANVARFEVSRMQYHMAIEEDFFARYDVADFEQRRVRSGDNLWKICAEAQIPMWLLKKFNRGVRFYDLRLGDYLWIPKVSAKDGGSHEAPEGFGEPVTESDAE